MTPIYIAHITCGPWLTLAARASEGVSACSLTLTRPYQDRLLHLSLPSFSLCASSFSPLRQCANKCPRDEASVAFRRKRGSVSARGNSRIASSKHGPPPLSSASVLGTDFLVPDNLLLLLYVHQRLNTDDGTLVGRGKQRDFEFAAPLGGVDVLPARRGHQRGGPRRPRQGEAPLAREEEEGGRGGGRGGGGEHGNQKSKPERRG